VASAIGIHAVRIEKPMDVRAALRDALAQPGPALVNLVTDPRAGSATEDPGKQIAGYTTAMSKEILVSGMGEVMAMARSNLRNVPRP
jgi:pyruvate dehydrogenase (quinone)